MKNKKTLTAMVMSLLMALTTTAINTQPTYALPPIDWTHYHSYSEIVTILLALNDTYPNIVDVSSIGKSWGNRNIYCVRLTNESDIEPKPEVFFVGYYHAREPITAELPLYFVVYAATHFGSNTTMTLLLNKSKIYVVVALNVDGFDLFQANDWQRKNACPTNEDGDGLIDEDPPEDEDGDGLIEQLIDYTDPEFPSLIRWEGTDNDGDGEYGEDWIGGVDLNRNYDISWQSGSTNPQSEIYKGPSPFSEPETQAIRNLALQHNFTYAVSFHSGSELILYPWGNTHTQTPDNAELVKIAQGLSTITGGTEYMQSSYLYYTYGEWGDWMYADRDVLAFTCEIFINNTWEGVIHPGPYPNTFWEGGLRYWFNPFPTAIEDVVQRWLPVFFYMTKQALANVTVEKVQSERTVVSQGYTTNINATVRNKGLLPETFNVTAYANTTVIQTQTVTVEVAATKELTFVWNTTGWSKGNYTISVEATPIHGETSTADNTLTDGVVRVSMVADLNCDMKVDGKDIAIVAKAFGSYPGHPNWNPNADINNDGKVDGKDIAIAAKYFGTREP